MLNFVLGWGVAQAPALDVYTKCLIPGSDLQAVNALLMELATAGMT